MWDDQVELCQPQYRLCHLSAPLASMLPISSYVTRMCYHTIDLSCIYNKSGSSIMMYQNAKAFQPEGIKESCAPKKC